MEYRFVHLLSKEARKKIIEEALSRRSLRELSETLGVSVAAISKYKSGITHPSDETLARLLEVAEEEEAREYVRIMVEDLVSGISELISWALERNLLDASVIAKVEKLHAKTLAAMTSRKRLSKM
ncbi:MAG: helix-turn-helix transcriptional regulator [Acidilobaceae archaeon]